MGKGELIRRVVHLENESSTAGMQIDLLGKRSPLVANFPSDQATRAVSSI